MEEIEKWKADQAKGWLAEVRGSCLRANTAKALLEDARGRADGLKAAGFGPVRSSRSDGAIAAALARLHDAADAYAEALEGFLGVQREAYEALSRMPDARESECLTLYYLLGRDWSGVAKAMSYSMDSVMQFRRKGLASAYDVMPHRFRDPLPPAL
ncbi:hypothetical protein QUW41_08290 [Slackia piriformis]|nr:hypothetical protein [Slackia piriformis]